MSTVSLSLHHQRRLGRYSRAAMLSEFFGSFMQHLAQWNDLRKTRQELESLDDRLLLDIGLSRADLLDYRGDPRTQRSGQSV